MFSLQSFICLLLALIVVPNKKGKDKETQDQLDGICAAFLGMGLGFSFIATMQYLISLF